MIELSFAEIFVVFIVAIFVIKPSDIPKIARIVKQILYYIENFKSNVKKEFTEIAGDKKDLDYIEGKDIEQINYYMKKICAHGGSYSGEYNLQSIKNEYLKLCTQKTTKTLKKNL